MKIKAFQEGYLAISIYDNPYWLDYPNIDKTKEEERIKARIWVDGNVQAIIDKRILTNENKPSV